MYQTTFDAATSIPVTTEARRDSSLLEKICDRLGQALKSGHAGNGKTKLPPTFIEANLLDEVMGPEIKRALRV